MFSKRQEGEELISKALSSASELDVAELSDEELEAALSKLRDDAFSGANPYIKHLLSAA